MDDNDNLIGKSKYDAALARLQPIILNAVTIKDCSNHFEELSLIDLIQNLETQFTAAKSGNLESAEGILMIQIHTLNSIFNKLTMRALKAEYMEQLEPEMRLALKTQNQCRITLETLASIKNPPTVNLVKQANIGYNQQINDTHSNVSAACTLKNENQQTQLLEKQHGQWLDSRTTGTTTPIDKELATMGELNRAQNP